MNKTDYDILFIGGVYEEGKEKDYLDKTKTGGIQNAVNTHQWNFIRGLDSNNESPVNILSARYVGSYPRYSEIYVKKNVWEHKDGAKDENIGFLNISIIKNFERKWKLVVKAKKWAQNKSNKEKVILCYYPSIPQMEAAIKAKKIESNIKIVLIIPDIPKFMNLQDKKSKAKDKISKIMEEQQEKLIQKFDGYILLTEEMQRPLKLQNKDKIIIEGIVDVTDKEKSQIILKSTHKNIVYSGSLHKKYGIQNYINAIRLIKDKDIVFYIFGSGEMEDEIIELSKKDERVKFMGYKPRSEVLEFQRNATLLINPRNDKEEFVKYSFPSKLIEYMLSGTPVLTSKLPCIPEEYYPYLFFIDGEITPQNLKNSILKNICLNEKVLERRGQEARKFVLENKNYIVQGEKILNLIKKIDLGGKSK